MLKQRGGPQATPHLSAGSKHTYHLPTPGSVLGFSSLAACLFFHPGVGCRHAGALPRGARRESFVKRRLPSLADVTRRQKFTHPLRLSFLFLNATLKINRGGGRRQPRAATYPEGPRGHREGTSGGVKKRPQSQASEERNWVITWPLLDLNNVDLNSYVKSPILTLYLVSQALSPASLSADDDFRVPSFLNFHLSQRIYSLSTSPRLKAANPVHGKIQTPAPFQQQTHKREREFARHK